MRLLKRPILFLNLVLPLFSLISATSPSRSQTAETATLINEILDIHAATSRLEKLAGVADRISYIESVALLSYQGSWKQEKANWPSEWPSPFFYDVYKLSERFRDDLVHIERSTERDKVLGEAERSDFDAIAIDVKAMLDESVVFFDLLKDEKMYEANSFYRDRTRDRYSSIQNAAYTLSLTLDDRINKAGQKLRLLK